MSTNWLERPLDIDFLLDSGLVFELNRQYLHPFGLALTVVTNDQGVKTFGLRDQRASPEKAVFDQGTLTIGRHKLEKFLAQFGFAQMETRRRKIGSSIQHVETWVGK